MTTKPMTWFCSWCHEAKQMNSHTMIWNFNDQLFADPIGYCSEECIKHALVRKEMALAAMEKAGA
jgi:hypothetical protein